ncbi:unnamed protein product, partial [Prorocentrum cordatum]
RRRRRSKRGRHGSPRRRSDYGEGLARPDSAAPPPWGTRSPAPSRPPSGTVATPTARTGGVRLRRHNDPPGHRDDRVCPRYGVAHRLVPAALGPVPGAPAALPRLLRGAPQRAVDALPAQRFHHLHRVRLLVLGDGWHIVWYGHHGVFLAHVAATLDRIPEQVLQGRRPRLRAVLAPDRPGEGRGLSGAPRGLARRAPGADPAARPRERPRSRAASVGGGHFRTGCSRRHAPRLCRRTAVRAVARGRARRECANTERRRTRGGTAPPA